MEIELNTLKSWPGGLSEENPLEAEQRTIKENQYNRIKN